MNEDVQIGDDKVSAIVNDHEENKSEPEKKKVKPVDLSFEPEKKKVKPVGLGFEPEFREYVL